MKYKIEDIRLLSHGIEFISKMKSERFICDMFRRKLNELLGFERQYIVNIHLTTQLSGHLKIYDPIGTFLDIDYYFKKSGREQEYDEEEISKLALEIIYEGLYKIGEDKKWDIEKISKAYQNCFLTNLKNEYFFKNKLFSAPNKRFFAGILNKFSSQTFESWLILYADRENEIARRLVYKDTSNIFEIEKFKWLDSNTIMFKFNGPKKEFVYTVENIIKGELPAMPSEIHKLFE